MGSLYNAIWKSLIGEEENIEFIFFHFLNGS